MSKISGKQKKLEESIVSLEKETLSKLQYVKIRIKDMTEVMSIGQSSVKAMEVRLGTVETHLVDYREE